MNSLHPKQDSVFTMSLKICGLSESHFWYLFVKLVSKHFNNALNGSTSLFSQHTSVFMYSKSVLYTNMSINANDINASLPHVEAVKITF